MFSFSISAFNNKRPLQNGTRFNFFFHNCPLYIVPEWHISLSYSSFFFFYIIKLYSIGLTYHFQILMLAVKCFNFSETDSKIIFLQLFYPDIHGVLSPVADRVTYCGENFWDRRKALEEKKGKINCLQWLRLICIKLSHNLQTLSLGNCSNCWAIRDRKTRALNCVTWF